MDDAAHGQDDEHYAPESGEHEDHELEPTDPAHVKDDEHYAPES